MNQYPRSVSIVFFSLQVLGVYLWGLAGVTKFLNPALLEGFVTRFQGSFLAELPGGSQAQFFAIAVVEVLVALLYLGSILKAEHYRGNPNTLRLALAATVGVLVVLGFGLRWIMDHQGFASIYFYIGATIVALLYVEKWGGRENLR